MSFQEAATDRCKDGLGTSEPGPLLASLRTFYQRPYSCEVPTQKMRAGSQVCGGDPLPQGWRPLCLGAPEASPLAAPGPCSQVLPLLQQEELLRPGPSEHAPCLQRGRFRLQKGELPDRAGARGDRQWAW